MWFALFAGGGFGGLGGGNSAANQITNDFLFTNLNTKLDTGLQGLQSMSYQNSRDIMQGNNQLLQQNAANASAAQLQACQNQGQTLTQLAQNNYDQQKCCCETNRNIDAVRYENAQNTCAITTALHAEGEATRALITANEMQALRDQLQAAQLQLGNVAQTQTVTTAIQNAVATLRPYPQPAYITSSPYVSSVCGCAC